MLSIFRLSQLHLFIYLFICLSISLINHQSCLNGYNQDFLLLQGQWNQNMDQMQFSPSPKEYLKSTTELSIVLLNRKDFEWLSPNYTNVETQTFYFTDLSNGNIGFAQIIHSNVMGLTTTAQFTFRLYNVKDKNINLWTSTKLEDFEIKESNFTLRIWV